MDIRSIIRNVPDFPKKGIMFRDITTLIENPEAFKYCIDQIAAHFKDVEFDVIVGVESRGFIFGAALAYAIGKPMMVVRKPGKLPCDVVFEEYELEYGTDKIEMHADSIKPGQKVLLIDDLLATGGTTKASTNMIEKVGGVIAGLAFIMELDFLNGREKLKDYDVLSLVHYDSEEE